MQDEKDFFIVGNIKEGKFKKIPSLLQKRRKTLKRPKLTKPKSKIKQYTKKLYNKKYWRRNKNKINRKRELKGWG